MMTKTLPSQCDGQSSLILHSYSRIVPRSNSKSPSMRPNYHNMPQELYENHVERKSKRPLKPRNGRRKSMRPKLTLSFWMLFRGMNQYTERDLRLSGQALIEQNIILLRLERQVHWFERRLWIGCVTCLVFQF